MEALGRTEYGDLLSRPEAIVAGWLIRNKVPFTIQESEAGGRMPGGMVVDFVIRFYPQRPRALRVQSYWHENEAARRFDLIQKAQLLQMGFEVADVWEEDLTNPDILEDVMMAAVYGIV